MFDTHRLRFEADDYSIEIQILFRENRKILYRERGGRNLDIDAEAVGPKWNQLNAVFPATISGAEAERIARNLAQALSHLGYEYLIYERGQNQIVSDIKRAEVKDRLRGLGFEASLLHGDKVKLKRIGPAEDKKFTPTDGIDVMKAVCDLRGVRSTLKLLAKSQAAL